MAHAARTPAPIPHFLSSSTKTMGVDEKDSPLGLLLDIFTRHKVCFFVGMYDNCHGGTSLPVPGYGAAI
eukprot:scaffold11551_cov144-Cylindrotheca_fusiformis.AAC.4